MRALLGESPSPENKLFLAMRSALSQALIQAVNLRLNAPDKYAALVLAAIQKQQSSSWQDNLNGMLELIEKIP